GEEGFFGGRGLGGVLFEEDFAAGAVEFGVEPALSGAFGLGDGKIDRDEGGIDLASRLANRVQLTSDGHKAYLEAVEGAFGADIDYAQLVKLYGATSDSAKGRYSPADCTGIIKTPIEGKPDPAHISTSFIERQNLTMRMHMRRFTQLTNAFSKKVENHAYAVAL